MVVELHGVNGSPFAIPRRQNWTTREDVASRVRQVLKRAAELAAADGAEVPWYGTVAFHVSVVKDLTRGKWTIRVTEE